MTEREKGAERGWIAEGEWRGVRRGQAQPDMGGERETAVPRLFPPDTQVCRMCGRLQGQLEEPWNSFPG